MLGLPGTEWTSAPKSAPPVRAKWRAVGAVRHTFTHFHLDLEVSIAAAPTKFTLPSGSLWTKPDDAKLPSVMKKALARALDEWPDAWSQSPQRGLRSE
jgi:A/G-specific adenine glycosylase